LPFAFCLGGPDSVQPSPLTPCTLENAENVLVSREEAKKGIYLIAGTEAQTGREQETGIARSNMREAKMEREKILKIYTDST
jgi:hypothetical protein